MKRRKSQHPRTRRNLLPRPRVITLLSEISDYPLTVVTAGAGYGKTTAVSHSVQTMGIPVQWLTVTEDERDPALFVTRLLHAVLPVDVPDQELDMVIQAAHHPLTWMSSADSAADLVHAYVHDETVLVIDDFHQLDDYATILEWLDAWLPRLPMNVHVVLVTRTQPGLRHLQTMHLRGEAMMVRERELAFTRDEIAFLFQSGSTDLAERPSGQHVEWLLERTRGMAMVLSVLRREWQSHKSFAQLEANLDTSSPVTAQVGQLFLAGLPATEREFFMKTSVLPSLRADVCNAITGRSGSDEVLRHWETTGYLSLEADGHTYTLHPLVREYLRSLLTPKERVNCLWRAIHWHLREGQVNRAVGYLFSLDDDEVIARELLPHIPKFLARGQVSTVKGWLERLSPGVVRRTSGLLFAKAEIARYTNQFAVALSDYRRAEQLALADRDERMVVRTMIGRARLYLDTIQPVLAVKYIREARQRVAREDVMQRYDIVQLAFENAINIGRLKRAERIQNVLAARDSEAVAMNNGDARFLLRTGQLAEAISLVKTRLGADRIEQRPALSYREVTLLLALMYAMTGAPDAAEEQAMQGHSVGDSLQAPFVQAVGYIRLGHARHLANPLSGDSLTAYQKAIELMDEMDIPRGKSEALLGLCLAYGYSGQYAIARNCAEQGVAIAERAADMWMAGLVKLALAQVSCVSGHYDEALDAASQCIRTFERCGDSFLVTASYLWRALALCGLNRAEQHDDLAVVLRRSAVYNHACLLERATLFGVRDVQHTVPLLQSHCKAGRESALAEQFLYRLGCRPDDAHPGYTLRVQTFGGLRVWRGFSEIRRKDWQREKARQLFQFLLTHRGTPMHREEITEQLWAEAPADVAERDFKVALNVLSSALEPAKQTRGPTVFVSREGSLYQLSDQSMLQVDRDEFETLVRAATKAVGSEKRELLRRALTLYVGDYLPEAKYEVWCEAERERLQRMFLTSAMDYAVLCLQERNYLEAIAACERLLTFEAGHEEACVVMMKAYAGLHNRSMIVHTFRNLERVVQRELGVSVLSSTRQAYLELIGEGM